ncbi:hypothetical protein HDIA_4713 [Hartmannibacter diazotrophicus]|uniref:MlaB-like STAS domain-containing protein n=1 Tax=Hartmannibacter diazotrophicus TaxID=1482074 RepID=A0A2C9DD56_9HYPH|nr:STAS domain-containing protein [Hartmannibacter diazotrophicus]SON58254.1 hypothetical protein HDIA_4713 [Hartmannibacter diazotrophicus]
MIGLPEICDIPAAVDLQARCLDLGPAQEISFSGAAVRRCGTPFIQVLLAAANAAKASGAKVDLADPSQVLRESLEGLGLTAQLVEWEQEKNA